MRMNLEGIRNKSARCMVGLMSGTSCDGVDAALVRVKGAGPEARVALLAFQTVPYTPDLRARLLAPEMDAQEVCLLNVAVGKQLAEAAASIVNTARQRGLTVDFVASHGHTLAHVPPGPNDEPGATLQVGEPAVIVEHTGLAVVSDFRARDMAAGGQGAPLVPYVDWLLFHRPDETITCLNIGGIANFTVVPPHLDQVYAFDTGPGNMPIDGVVSELTRGRKSFDEDGTMAAQGKMIEPLHDGLLAHPYVAQKPPKSTGREMFGPNVYLKDVLAARDTSKPEDLVATVTRAVASTIVDAYNRFIAPEADVARIIVSGGGAHNKTLLQYVREGIHNVEILLSDACGFPANAREAIAFAVLGNETVCGIPANVPGATGARHAVVLGKITPNG